MKNFQILKIVFRILFLSIATISLWFYLDYKQAIDTQFSIEYKFIEKKANKGGRGTHYEMKVYYANKYYNISLTKQEYTNIDNNQFPTLYFSEKNKDIFSNWELRLTLRITLLFFGLFLISWFPLLSPSTDQVKKSKTLSR